MTLCGTHASPQLQSARAFSRGCHNLLLVLLSKTWSLASRAAEGWWVCLLPLRTPISTAQDGGLQSGPWGFPSCTWHRGPEGACLSCVIQSHAVSHNFYLSLFACLAPTNNSYGLLPQLLLESCSRISLHRRLEAF